VKKLSEREADKRIAQIKADIDAKILEIESIAEAAGIQVYMGFDPKNNGGYDHGYTYTPTGWESSSVDCGEDPGSVGIGRWMSSTEKCN
jgi:hypothetical protein